MVLVIYHEAYLTSIGHVIERVLALGTDCFSVDASVVSAAVVLACGLHYYLEAVLSPFRVSYKIQF